jgi:hypothetical protein
VSFFTDFPLYDVGDCLLKFSPGGGSGTGPGNAPGIISAIGTVRAELESSLALYESVVDANQKLSTIEVLEMALPTESEFVRDVLLQRHPLSDEVLKKVIMYSHKLNPWHLTQVFLANSPLSKEVFHSIENSSILSDFFMEFLYDADHGTSLRKLMESEISYYGSELDRLHNELLVSLVHYQTEGGTEVDILMDYQPYQAAIEECDSDKYLYDRVGFSTWTGDIEQALSYIPEQDDWSTYRELLSLGATVSGNWEQVSQEVRDNLLVLSQDTGNDFCHFARSMLFESGLYLEDPIPVFPIQYRSLQIEEKRNDRRDPLLGIWPNPTSSASWIHYPIEADGIGQLRVMNTNGQIVSEMLLQSNGLVELDMSRFVAGIYLIQLIVEDKIVDSTKLTVIE